MQQQKIESIMIESSDIFLGERELSLINVMSTTVHFLAFYVEAPFDFTLIFLSVQSFRSSGGFFF